MVDSSELLRRPKEMMWRKSTHSTVPAALKAFFNTAVFNAIPGLLWPRRNHLEV